MTDTSRDGTRPRKPSGDDSGAEEQQSLFDKVMPDGVRRGIEALLEGKLKHLVAELKLPKEIISHIMAQIDDTKQATVGVISREVREFLERTNLADELAKLLTQISLQIKTDIRFVPNENAIQGTADKSNPNAKTEKKKHRLSDNEGWTSLWPRRASSPPPTPAEAVVSPGDPPANDKHD